MTDKRGGSCNSCNASHGSTFLKSRFSVPPCSKDSGKLFTWKHLLAVFQFFYLTFICLVKYIVSLVEQTSRNRTPSWLNKVYFKGVRGGDKTVRSKVDNTELITFAITKVDKEKTNWITLIMFIKKQHLNRTIRKVLGEVGNFSAAWVSLITFLLYEFF